MFEFLCRHVEYATNGGNIRSMITIFPPRKNGQEDFRLWNAQLLSYAGYLQPDGSTIGDPGHVQFTRVCQRLGWKGKGGRFDILPWILSAPGEGPKLYDVPDELILRVKLEHPRFEWFAEMGLEWFALPTVAGLLFDCGGISFPAAPFNGWYMGTEIGTRNLCDPHHYNITEEVALKMGLDTSSPATLWKDQALVEINIAVLHSYQKQNIVIVDHHTLAESFMKHMENEQKQRGGCPADWVWIVPPLSSSLTPVFHQEMLNYVLKPSYEYQVMCMEDYDVRNLEQESLFIVVTSTFGNGNPPDNGKVACSSYNFALSSDASMISLESVSQWNKDKFRTSVVEGIHHDICEGLANVHNKKVQPCKVLSRIRLQPLCSERQTILVRLDTRQATNLTYEPGDHLSVFPVNPSNVVNQIMSFLDPSDRSERDLVQVETFVDGVWQPYNRLPPCTMHTALSRYLDITTPPAPTILEHLAATATEKLDQLKLQRLCE
ncbi:nitric oxide synthase, salivary gland-like, partial [Limulus polyphemus]|uniref:nitric-oxide synthase (NADPH) n=1 Tax=Limulus polyphemus TaxID=6850 RepID=A0ABM1RXA1_LIMPO